MRMHAVETGTLFPTGYRFLHVSQHDSIIFGGGVEFLFKEYLDLKTHISEKVETFELMDLGNRERFPCLHSLI